MNRRHLLVGGTAVALAGAGLVTLGLRQMGSMEEYDSAVAATRAALSERPDMRDLIRYATLAAKDTIPSRGDLASGRIGSRSSPTSPGERPRSTPTTIICS